MIQKQIASFVPDLFLGVLDYFRFPSRRDSWGGPFNGQVGRREIFEAIAKFQKPSLIIETGTYRGTTTEILASVNCSVITIEGDARNYGFSLLRVRKIRNVRALKGDSREILRRDFGYRAARTGTVFAYLDAHWNADLPLADEIDIIFTHDADAIVMIDDFQVPDDPGYGYDNYGFGKALTREYISGMMSKYTLNAFYPVLASYEETGMKRGCVVLANRDRWQNKLLSTGVLRLGREFSQLCTDDLVISPTIEIT